jgi:glycosyltransferase involved in cell wall biosynthesis
MSDLRIAVYTIALNEAHFVDRWVASARDADCLLVADTGSTDKTVRLLEAFDLHHYQIRVKPWRFDDARNAALALLPSDIDIAVALDMDEILTPNWRKHLEASWTGNRLRYGYVWSWTANGRPDLTFQGDKIAGRHTHRWKHPVHEVLVPTGQEVQSHCPEVLIEHHPDPSKSRGQYLTLLQLSVQEDPHDDRNSHYLGREYFFHRRYKEAIAEFERHLKLPKAVWLPERASSMRYLGKCYQALNDYPNAYKWFVQATLEDSTLREAWIDAATFLLARNNFHITIDFCQRALSLPPTTSYMAERYANNEGPYDLSAIAYYHIGQKEKAIALAQQALQFNPEDARLQNNLKMMVGND